jgi:hypothetical protein
LPLREGTGDEKCQREEGERSEHGKTDEAANAVQLRLVRFGPPEEGQKRPENIDDCLDEIGDHAVTRIRAIIRGTADREQNDSAVRAYAVGMQGGPERLKIWLIAGAIIIALALAILTGTGILPGETPGPISENKFGR